MKICAECFHEHYPSQRVTRVSLGRQCALCKKDARKETLVVVDNVGQR